MAHVRQGITSKECKGISWLADDDPNDVSLSRFIFPMCLGSHVVQRHNSVLVAYQNIIAPQVRNVVGHIAFEDVFSHRDLARYEVQFRNNDDKRS